MNRKKQLLWIGNGMTVLPDRICSTGSVLIRNGKIAAVNEPCPPEAEIIDAEGNYILAGFIDLHLHGGGNADFMDGDPESILQVAKAHCQHGTTALAATTMTCEDELLEKVIGSFLTALKKGSEGAELFLAVSPDSPIMQYALVPPYQDQNHDVRSISVTPSPSADDMFYQAELREDGWSFTLIMPLKKRGLDASKFYFDLIIRTSSTIKMHPYERKPLWGSLMDYANANELVPLSAEMK